MGEAKLKGSKPTARSGPHGHDYYCRNRCGQVVYSKNTNQTFNERKTPYWGWCQKCKGDAFALEGLRALETVIAASTTQDIALKTVKKGIMLSDGQLYDLAAPLLTLPSFLALPVVTVIDKQLLGETIEQNTG